MEKKWKILLTVAVVYVLILIPISYVGLSGMSGSGCYFELGMFRLKCGEYFGLVLSILILLVGVGGCITYLYGKKKVV